MHVRRTAAAIAVTLTAVLVVPSLAGVASAQFPGTNGVVAFARNRHGNGHIFTINADGTGEQQLTFGTSSDSQPAWSPDGTRLAFVRCCPHGVHQIYVMDVAHGGAPVNISTSSRNQTSPTWGPNGMRIAFQSAARIWRMSANGDNQVQISPKRVTGYDPAWGPNNLIAFGRCCTDDVEQTIWTIRPDGTHLEQYIELHEDDGASFEPDWAPDGSQVAFSQNFSGQDGGGTGVYYGAGSAYTYFTTQNHDCSQDFSCTADTNPSWSPDGTFVAFESFDLGLSKTKIYVLNNCACPGHATYLTDGHDPAWQSVPSA